MNRLLLISLLLPSFLFAQKLPSIEDKTREMKKFPGYMDFYWDSTSGKVWLDVNKLDSELLYYVSLPAGLGSNDIGLDRGLLGGEKIVKF